jgi:hypothetical protein
MVAKEATECSSHEVQCSNGCARCPPGVRNVHDIAVVVADASSGFVASVYISKIVERVNGVECVTKQGISFGI